MLPKMGWLHKMEIGCLWLLFYLPISRAHVKNLSGNLFLRIAPQSLHCSKSASLAKGTAHFAYFSHLPFYPDLQTFAKLPFSSAIKQNHKLQTLRTTAPQDARLCSEACPTTTILRKLDAAAGSSLRNTISILFEQWSNLWHLDCCLPPHCWEKEEKE